MRQKIPQLDAVRGIAIILVLIHNLHRFYWPPLTLISKYGWMGVDLFFVLSGFLITGILLDAKSSANYFRNFYARRGLRIWPLYYLMLVIMFVAVPLIRPQDAAEIFQRSTPWWSYVFFLQNFLVAAPALAAGSLGVSWSLAVEEIFYLVWPFFVRYLSVERLQLIAWVVLLISPRLRLDFLSRHWIIYSNPFCRLDGLMAGALLAILVRKRGFAPIRLVKLGWVALLVGVPLAITTAAYGLLWLTYSMTAVASAAFVYLGLFEANSWFRGLLMNRFLIFTGTISYALYLLHKIPDDVIKRLLWKDAHPLAAFWAILAISYLAAVVSRSLVEKPFLSLKRFFEMESRSKLEAKVASREARGSEAR
ncbi:MAG TPA: acyltransferase [Candidatus Limnocylindrales bacterium]|nr:acyltransferase [Candidatus Limnocylindrales bacterium]